MDGATSERLYGLLPAVYRVRDAEQGWVLRALLGVLDREAGAVEEDIARLYDNWFIETCDEWVVPYIGDLLGVRGLVPVRSGPFTQRGVVANTLGYRRRKGSAAVLEQLARDVTGWPAKAVEFFRILATTQFLNHVRPANLVTADLRDEHGMELVGTPFDRAAHTAEVRHVDRARGRYNIPNVGLFLWRLQSYRVTEGSARPVPAASAAEEGRYTFSPLGIDAPLFNLARTEAGITHLALETDVPQPIRRRALADEVAARRAGEIGGEEGRNLYLGEPPVVEVFLNDESDPVGVDDLAVCDLSDAPTAIPEGWRRPSPGVRVGVDPVLGRLALPAGAAPVPVRVRYCYGFAGDLGGGPYDRRDSVAEVLGRADVPDRQKGVRRGAAPADPDLFDTLADAIDEWNLEPVALGVIALMDSRTYDEPLPEIVVPEGCRLILVAADWPVDQTDLGPVHRAGRLTPAGRRPHVRADLEVRGTAPAGSPSPGEVVVDGLLLEGSLTVRPGNLGALRVAHSTLVPVPGATSLVVESGGAGGLDNGALRVEVLRAICGPLAVAGSAMAVEVTDAIVDAPLPGGGHGAAVVGPDLRLESVTVLGSTVARSLHASNTIFLEPVTVERRQTGCVRFSFVPAGSVVPRRFRCHPVDPSAPGAARPRFSSTTYGHPAYGQLSAACPPEISAGAEDESEMGAFRFLQQPHRLANLRVTLEEYLRLGLEAGIFPVT